MIKSYDLSVARCKVPGGDMCMFFLAPPDARIGSFFFAEDIAGAPENGQWKPAKILNTANLPCDRDLVSLTKIKSVTLPHVGGAGGVKSVLTLVPGRGNYQYIADGLFSLERAFLVPDGIWASWEERLSQQRATSGRPSLLPPVSEPVSKIASETAMSGTSLPGSAMSSRTSSGTSAGRASPMESTRNDPFGLRDFSMNDLSSAHLRVDEDRYHDRSRSRTRGTQRGKAGGKSR